MQLKTVTKWVLLGYLVTGNLSRLNLFGTLSAPVLELGAVFLGWGSFFGSLRAVRRSILLITTLVFGSFLLGALKYGFEASPLFYGIRLVGILLAGDLLGRILVIENSGTCDGAFKDLIDSFLVFVGFGWLLFLTYPDSTRLWADLGQLGIVFEGDPHQGRFVSLLFDPNYFAVIGVLPLLFLILKWKELNRAYRYAAVATISSALLLSFSRSGLLTLLTCFAVFLYQSGKTKRKKVIHFFMHLFFFGLFTSIFLLYTEPGARMLDRILSVAEDDSALARIENNRVGLEIFFSSPWFGVGYNYVSLVMKSLMGSASPDSSLINILANFGFIAGTIFFTCYFHHFVTAARKFTDNDPLFSRQLSTVFVFYISMCFFVASIFNNLLFYSYWIFLVSAFVSICRISSLSLTNIARTERTK